MFLLSFQGNPKFQNIKYSLKTFGSVHFFALNYNPALYFNHNNSEILSNAGYRVHFTLTP